MAAHRYWRVINITNGGGSFLEPQEVHLYEGPIDRTSGSGTATVTASASGGGGGGTDCTNLIDNNIFSGKFWAKATAEDPSFWIKYDFGSGKAYDIDGFSQYTSSAASRIDGFEWEWSDDDSSWTSAGTGNTYAINGQSPIYLINGGQAVIYVSYPVGFLTRVAKSVGKNVDITSTAAVAMAKGFFSLIEVTATGTLEVLRDYTKLLAFAGTATLDTIKTMFKTFSSTHSGSVQLSRDYTKILGITVTGAPLMLRKIALSFAMGATAALDAIRLRGINVAIAVASAITVVRQKVGFFKQTDPDDTAVIDVRPAHAEVPKRDTKVVF